MIPYPVPHILTMNLVTVSNGDYLPLAHTQIADATTTEAYNQTYMFKSGTWLGLSVYVRIANASGDVTFTVRKNGADTGLTITIPQNTTGLFQDLTNTVSVAVGDLMSIGVTATAGTIDPISVTTLFESDSGSSVQYFMAHSDTGSTFSNSARFIRPSSNNIANNVTVEANAENMIQHDSTIEGVAVYVSSNTRTGTTTVRSRVNSTIGISVSFATTLTGMFTNTGSQSMTAGDDFNSEYFFSGGSGSVVLRTVVLCVVSTNPREITFLSGNQVNRNTTNTNNSWNFAGGLSMFSGATESVGRSYPITPGVFSGLAYYASANTSTQDLAMVMRKNGADGNETITYTGTGWIQDTTNSDVFDNNDFSTIRATRAASGSGTTTFQHHSIKYTMDPLLKIVVS